jgi:hypothetical protein
MIRTVTNIGLHREAIITAKGGPDYSPKNAHKDSKSFKVWQQQRALWKRLYTPAKIKDDACQQYDTDMIQMFVE